MFKYAGIFGAVLAVAMNDLPIYLVISFGLIREKLSCTKQDIFATVVLATLIGLFIVIRFCFDMGVPGKSMLMI